MTITSPSEPARDNLATSPLWLHPAPASGPADMASLDVTAVAVSVEMVLVFASTTEVLSAEDRLEAGNFNFSLIPVPKEVNPNCGLALSFPEDLAPDIARVLAADGLGPIAVYRRQGGEYLPSGPGVFTRPAQPEAADKVA